MWSYRAKTGKKRKRKQLSLPGGEFRISGAAQFPGLMSGFLLRESWGMLDLIFFDAY